MTVFIGYDIESTGLRLGKAEVIQIGATRLDDVTLRPTAVKFERKLLVEHPENVEPNTLGVFNHYDPEVWAREGVPQHQGWRDFADWVFTVGGGGVVKPQLVGHNIGKFDWPMSEHWWTLHHCVPHLDYHLIDTSPLFIQFKRLAGITSRGMGLKDACTLFGVTNPKAHDALADALTDSMCFCLMQWYLDALIDVGRGFTHQEYLDEAYRRAGMPRNSSVLISRERTSNEPPAPA